MPRGAGSGLAGGNLTGTSTRHARRCEKSWSEVGIEYLQNSMQDGRFYLLEQDQFGHLDWIKEAGMYCVDAHGHPVDAYNHAMDETRYAHNHFAKTYVYCGGGRPCLSA